MRTQVKESIVGVPGEKKGEIELNTTMIHCVYIYWLHVKIAK